jgi:DNA-binding transcriptional ArsR family regulator
MSPSTPDGPKAAPRRSHEPRNTVVRTVRKTAPLFAALGDSTRLQIVGRLAGGAVLSIAALTAGTGVTRQAITKHLQVLDDAGLVHSTWQGRERMWSLEPAQIAVARRTLDLISEQWTSALDRLAAFVEADPG